MKLLDAQREFRIRLYCWAKSEWSDEIRTSFPSLGTFKSGAPWRTLQFLKQLDGSSQATLTRALAKRTLPDADAIGEGITAEEQTLMSRHDDFFRIKGIYDRVKQFEKEGQLAPARMAFRVIRADALKALGEPSFVNESWLRSKLDAAFEFVPMEYSTELSLKRDAGEKVKFARRQDMRKLTIEKFKNTFPDHCLKDELFERAAEPCFETQICGWILSTYFSYGDEGTMRFFHGIESEDTFRQQGPEGPFSQRLSLGYNFSYCNVLGFGSAEWEYLLPGDIEPACDAAIGFCARFFSLAPKLLKGLELSKIQIE